MTQDLSYHVVNQLTRNDHPQYQLTANNPTTVVTTLTAGMNLAVTGGDGAGHGTLTVAESGDATWTVVSSFANSWVNFGGIYMTAGFRKVAGRIHLRGTIKSGTVNTAAFTLPAGYRPSATLLYACNSNGAMGQLTVNTDGTVVPSIGSNASFSLDNVGFDTL